MFLSAGNCTVSEPGCETVWNTNVDYLYYELVAGTLSGDRLQSFCGFDFNAVNN